MEAAHEAGLSYGKYQAFLALQALDPSVTAEEVQGMTMRELRDRIAALGGDPDAVGSHSQTSGHHSNGVGTSSSADDSGTGSTQGNGQGHGYGSGQGSGSGSRGHGHSGHN